MSLKIMVCRRQPLSLNSNQVLAAPCGHTVLRLNDSQELGNERRHSGSM